MNSRPLALQTARLLQRSLAPGFERQLRFYSNGRNGGMRAALGHPGFVVVPQQTAFIVERFGKFRKILPPGFHFLIPVVDQVAYKHSLKEEAIAIPNQTAITRDNVTIQLDGVLFVKIENPYDASYGVENPLYVISQLAQTTMRSELGKLTLDDTFLERDSLNAAIRKAMNDAAGSWGIKCMRYEIRDILVPHNIRLAMEKQAEAERKKRADILQSEGERESDINIATGRRQAAILQAQGEAESIRQRAAATAGGIRSVAEALVEGGGKDAAALQVAEQYVEAFGRMARSSNTIVVPANTGDAASMVAQAMAVFGGARKSIGDNFAEDPSSPSSASAPAPSSVHGGAASGAT